ncbi:MAG: Gfo/Idh/MocA family oxidoreductase [Desulfobacterales bacterium]|nr:Gfo/Idh/MocA family oxidoreductase [Desulfobacterales bacterium]
MNEKRKTMMDHTTKKLRVGVVGVGYLGKFHAEKYAGMAQVELVGVADVDPSKAGQVAKKVGTAAYLDYRELLGKVDAVSIVVPTPDHFRVSRDFLENDVDVLIEKPMTATLEDADALIRISEARGLIIQVGHLERFNPAVVALQDILHNPMFIESHRVSVYNERGMDVSVVHDLMIHDIDIITNFVKSDIQNIHAAGVPVISEHVDIANARLEFVNGCVANVTASRIATKNERTIRLFQKDAYISVNFSNHEITVIRQNKEGKNNNGLIPGMDINHLCFTKSDALQDELKSFVTKVMRREVPEVTGQEGRDALKIALSIVDQINRNNRILFSKMQGGNLTIE